MKKYLFSLFLAFFALTGYAHGFDFKGLQPLAPYGVFSTFSAESLSKGKAGVAVGFEKSESPDFYRITNQFGYGLTNNMELDITIPYVISWEGSTDGLEDMSIGIKHRFFEEGKYGPSIAYLITASLNTGKSDFSTEGSIGGGIIVSKRVGPVKGHLNLFYVSPGSGKFKDEITFAAGLDFSASHTFTILSELYMKKSYSGGVERLETRFGYRLRTSENLFTTLGVGLDFKNRSPEYRLLLSLTYLFPSEEKKIKRIYEEEKEGE
jgi:hypothetical protein